ncbi:MAG: hypothetical protein DRI69_07235 [Bacteroidetes bacterium]|nr:MAG: hypothetical protein DRI69_07235 [Bacteroidota bacterium]
MIKRTAFFGLLLALSLSSCDDAQDINPTANIGDTEMTTVAEDLVSLEYVSNETDEITDALIEMREPGDPGNPNDPGDPSDCPTVTFENPQGEFPNTITIDFGDACEHNGHVRSGKIIIYQTAPMFESGASRTTTYEDYFTDGIEHLGTKVITNAGFDDAGNVTFTRFVDIQLIFPDGQIASWTAEYVKTQVAGADTDIRKDDVFEISGSTSGVNRKGFEFSSRIIENLVRSRDCRWITAGIITFEVITDQGTMTRTIDYGFPDAGCDNLAEVTMGDGTVKIIYIHKRWW